MLTATSAPALAGPVPPHQVAAAGTEAAVLPPSQPEGMTMPGRRSETVDLRDSAALVLVGSMLIGLAAAVRRTA